MLASAINSQRGIMVDGMIYSFSLCKKPPSGPILQILGIFKTLEQNPDSAAPFDASTNGTDRKSTRLNSSH